MQANFLLHVKTTDELDPALERRRHICEKRKETCQPVPVIVGDFSTGTLKSFVSCDNILYAVESPLKCIDICYKLYHCLNASYPAESQHTWHFVQKYVYDTTTSYDKTYVSVSELVTELNQIN